jgi:UDP-2,3-diacylglucosamine pyrophosphatase LpxH
MKGAIMRTVTIDFSADETRRIVSFGGYDGEHNETNLCAILPPRLLSEEVTQYRFVFTNSNGEEITKEPLKAIDGAVSYLLPQQVMVYPELKFYVAALTYDGMENLVVLGKTATATLTIEYPSDGVETEENPYPDNIPIGYTVRNSADGIRSAEDASVNELATEKAISEALEEEKNGRYSKEESDNRFANAINGKASGNPIALTDVSPLEHKILVTTDVAEVGIKKYGKNLFPKYKPNVVTKNGVTIERKEDGSIVLNGQATVGFGHNIGYQVCKDIPAGSNITISSEGTPTQIWNNTFVFNVNILKSDGKTVAKALADVSASSRTGTIPDDFGGVSATISIYPGAGEMKNVTFRPMIEVGSTATSYEPYKEPELYATDENKELKLVGNGESMTLIADNGATITAEYNRDINKVSFGEGGISIVDQNYNPNSANAQSGKAVAQAIAGIGGGGGGGGAVASVNGQTGVVVLDAEDVGALPSSTKIPSKVSDLTNDKGYITGYTETDPTVPEWAKASTKPTYTASEVGALPSTTVIPSKTSQLTNDSGYLTSIPSEYVTETELNAKKYLTSYTETDPTVPSWAKASNKPSYTKSEVGLGNVDNVKQYSASNPPPYPVTKVNGKTGDVTLTASDVGIDVIPDYVKTEAESVIDRVIQAQGNRTFTFAAITDLHYGNGGYTDGIKHACQALKYIDERIKLDAVAVLGDYTDGMSATNYEGAIVDLKAVNSLLDDLRFAPNFRVQGNHDFIVSKSPKISRYIQAYSDGVVWGDRLGGFFYRDFEEFKLRVIAVNGNEVYGDYLHCTDEQYNWFIDSLDLSAKETAEEWQILILSHYPLDWFAYNNAYYFWQILNAYQNGGNWSNGAGTISCNFADKNKAKIVGNIHGHIHNLLVKNISAGQPNTTETTIDVKRISTPESCVGRANSYNGDWDYNPFGEETSYPKTQNTADDTSFCIYCVDLDTYTIKAICYGAGYDREIIYHEGEAEIINWLYAGVDTNGNLYNGKGYKEDYRLNSSGVESQHGGMDVTGYIPIKAGDVIRITGAGNGGNTAYFHYYSEKFVWLAKADNDKTEGTSPNNTYSVTNADAKYFRCTAAFNENTRITINEPIE